jgi:hypothetical protein
VFFAADLWAQAGAFRTLKTQGFDIECIRIEDSQPRNKLITATLIAAGAVQQLVHGRDGDQGHLRPCTDVFEPEDIPLLEAWCAKLEGKTQRQKNPHPKQPSPTPPGSADAWVDGPDITEKQAPSSRSEDGSNSRLPSERRTCSMKCALCESGSPLAGRICVVLMG